MANIRHGFGRECLFRFYGEHNSKNRKGSCRDVTWRGLVGPWCLIRDWSYLLTFRTWLISMCDMTHSCDTIPVHMQIRHEHSTSECWECAKCHFLIFFAAFDCMKTFTFHFRLSVWDHVSTRREVVEFCECVVAAKNHAQMHVFFPKLKIKRSYFHAKGSRGISVGCTKHTNDFLLSLLSTGSTSTRVGKQGRVNVGLVHVHLFWWTLIIWKRKRK